MNYTTGPWKVQSYQLHFDSMPTVVGGHHETTGGTWPLFNPDAKKEIAGKAEIMLAALERIERTTYDAMTAALARGAIEKVFDEMKLKKVKLTMEYVIVADDYNEDEVAREFARDALKDFSKQDFDIEVCDYFKNNVSGWDEHCIPYGGDGNTTTGEYML